MMETDARREYRRAYYQQHKAEYAARKARYAAARKLLKASREDFMIYIPPLSPAQTAVIFWMAQGYSNREIADTLAISPGEVANRIAAMYQKLHVHNSRQAIHWFYQTTRHWQLKETV